MAIANLHETLLMYTMRKNQLTLEIMELQSQKQLALSSTADTNNLLSSSQAELREFYKNLYNENEEYQCNYTDYTEIPDFEEAMARITAQYQDQLDELAEWETQLNAQITTKSAEMEEINAYEESIKAMLQSNIQEDFNYGLNK